MSKFYDVIKSLGVVGETAIENIVNTLEEGLIKSYPKETTIKFLKGYFQREHDIKLFVDEKPDDQYFAIVARNVDLTDYVDIVNKKLEVYGWYVVKSNQHRLVIEPKTADRNHEKKDGWQYYHITNKTYYNKIKKNGLNPRETTTTFNHPADRIYLLYTDDMSLVKSITEILFMDKKNKLVDSGNDDGRWDEDQIVILNVDLPEGIERFDDPMASGGKTFDAVYVKKSINPANIKVIHTGEF
jgi:hypothetical protein